MNNSTEVKYKVEWMMNSIDKYKVELWTHQDKCLSLFFFIGTFAFLSLSSFSPCSSTLKRLFGQHFLVNLNKNSIASVLSKLLSRMILSFLQRCSRSSEGYLLQSDSPIFLETSSQFREAIFTVPGNDFWVSFLLLCSSLHKARDGHVSHSFWWYICWGGGGAASRKFSLCFSH